MDQIKGRVVLASGSPRRKEIMEQQLGFKDVHVMPSHFGEDLVKDDCAPFEYPIKTATRKALDVYKSELNADVSPDLLVAADTVIELNGIIMEKPRDFVHHVAMLKQLRDNNGPHHVFTGVVAIVPFEKPVLPGYALDTALGVSKVRFRKDISDDELMKYVHLGEGTDAAGGYKIQGVGGTFIDTVEGDKFNVIGLPVEETKALIEKVWEQSKNHEDDEPEELSDDSGQIAYY